MDEDCYLAVGETLHSSTPIWERKTTLSPHFAAPIPS